MITGRKTNPQKTFFVFGDIVAVRPAQGPTKLEVRYAMGRWGLCLATRVLRRSRTRVFPVQEPIFSEDRCCKYGYDRGGLNKIKI